VLTTSTSTTRRRAAWLAGPLGWALFLALSAGSAWAQDAGDEQGPPAPQVAADAGAESAADALNKALDSTATQWSFQAAYQAMPDYYSDTLDSGQTRPAGSTDYVQLRIMAPLAFKKLTILPRVTLRHYENAQGQSGMGNTEIFALMVPKSWDWGSGRTGIGPLVTLPGNKDVSRDEWGYGFAAAIVNGSGKWFYGLLFTQTWRAVDPTTLPPTSSDTNPLGIAPFLNFQLGGGFVALSGAVGGPFGLFGEVYGSFAFGQDVPDGHTVQVGTTVLLGRAFQVDVRGGIGVVDNVPDWLGGAGLAFRIPN
jgi:hypothetical protein